MTARSGPPMPPLSVAPMMDITDRHFRSFVRTISRHTLLYTEMVTEQAIRFGDAGRLLGHDAAEHPLALQLGGSDPAGLAAAARIGFDFGYDEINLNVGCPSDRVQSGSFGACLMLDPPRVAEIAAALRAATPLPVTVKHRLGVDERDSFAELLDFVDTVAAAGVTRFTVHARKAWLQGLSPRENREVPPLDHEAVHRLARLRPQLEFELNGGIGGVAAALPHLRRGLGGVMLGRAVAADPYVLATADRDVFGAEGAVVSRGEAVRSWLPYVERQLTAGVPFRVLARPLLGMFGGLRGARRWRRFLSEASQDPAAGPRHILAALELIPGEDRESPPADYRAADAVAERQAAAATLVHG